MLVQRYNLFYIYLISATNVATLMVHEIALGYIAIILCHPSVRFLDPLLVESYLLEPHHIICIYLILPMGAKVHVIHCWPKLKLLLKLISLGRENT